LNLLIFLLIWQNLRFWSICQVFYTGVLLSISIGMLLQDI